jgi:hypothetical protein
LPRPKRLFVLDEAKARKYRRSYHLPDRSRFENQSASKALNRMRRLYRQALRFPELDARINAVLRRRGGHPRYESDTKCGPSARTPLSSVWPPSIRTALESNFPTARRKVGKKELGILGLPRPQPGYRNNPQVSSMRFGASTRMSAVVLWTNMVVQDSQSLRQTHRQYGGLPDNPWRRVSLRAEQCGQAWLVFPIPKRADFLRALFITPFDPCRFRGPELARRRPGRWGRARWVWVNSWIWNSPVKFLNPKVPAGGLRMVKKMKMPSRGIGPGEMPQEIKTQLACAFCAPRGKTTGRRKSLRPAVSRGGRAGRHTAGSYLSKASASNDDRGAISMRAKMRRQVPAQSPALSSIRPRSPQFGRSTHSSSEGTGLAAGATLTSHRKEPDRRPVSYYHLPV